MAKRAVSEAPVTEEAQGFLPMRAPKRQADRNGKRNVGGQIDVRTARALAILAAKEDKTQVALLEEAIADLFEKYQHTV
jgi:hypothetical protein